jgi:hypothetical protein
VGEGDGEECLEAVAGGDFWGFYYYGVEVVDVDVEVCPAFSFLW